MSTQNAASALISPHALKARLDAPGLSLIDATLAFPGWPEPTDGRIPGAAFMDVDAVADASSALPHMLPPAAPFEAFARAAGVSADGEVVVYDRMGLASAPRGWWMFRAMGHPRVRVLDGGLPGWIAAGGPVEPGPAPTSAQAKGNFRARLQPDLVAGRADVAEALKTGRVQVLDVRSAGRFAGTAPEPRAGLRGGHMPGARNAPWTDLVTPDGRLQDKEALRAVFARAGVELHRPVVTSCGSGITACIGALALEELGHRQWAVYDGSWAEWGSRADTPVVEGAAG